MADDEIERLLREVAESTGSSSGASARTGATSGFSEEAKPDKASSNASVLGLARGRMGFAVVAGAVIGVAGWGIGLLIHAAGVFLGGRWLGAEWERRKVEELVAQQRRADGR